MGISSRKLNLFSQSRFILLFFAATISSAVMKHLSMLAEDSGTQNMSLARGARLG